MNWIRILLRQDAWRGQALSSFFALWTVFYMLRAHLPYIRLPNEQNIDEGYLLAIGQRMLAGKWLPFVDGVAHSGPLFLFSGAPLAALGEFSWLPIRIVAALSFATMCALTWLAGRLSGHPVAGAIGALSIPLFMIFRWLPLDGLAYNAEVPVNLFILGSLCCVAKVRTAPGKSALRWALGAGLLAAFAGLSKQIGVMQAGVIAAAQVLIVFGVAQHSSDKRRLLAYFALGAVVPGILVLLWFFAHGALKDFWYYVVTYNKDIYMHFATTSRLELFGRWLVARPIETVAGVALVSWGFARALALCGEAGFRNDIASGWFPLTLCGLAITGVIGARASQREFEHYYNIAVPWFGLLTGLIAEAAVGAAHGRWATLGRVALFAPLVAIFEVMWAYKAQNLLGWTGRDLAPLASVPLVPKVCEQVQKHTPEGQPTFVWGFRPGLYVSCQRRPASRFVFSTMVAGYVPWNGLYSKELDDRLTVPGSRELLLAELEATKPQIIVDDGHWSLHGRPMTRYDLFATYLATHYKRIGEVEKMLVYLRKDPG